MIEYKSHPAAELFPLLVGDEFNALCSDIRANGLREPIIVHDGMILDGRNRYRACQQIGVTIKSEPWDGDGTPEAFVISKNIMRRHLTPSQRAMLISKFVTQKSGHRVDYTLKSTAEAITAPVLSVPHAAQIAGVEKTIIGKARVVREQGSPDLVSAVEGGERSVHSAYEQVKDGTPEDRKKRLTAADKNRKHTRARMSKYWKQLKEGLELLGTLPDVEDVFTSIPCGQESQVAFIERRLPAALNWLKEFEGVWNERDSRDSSADDEQEAA